MSTSNNRRYVKFSKKKFEYELYQYKKDGIIPRYENITPYMQHKGSVVYEAVYWIPTKYKQVNILIYSSVSDSAEGQRVRGKGEDAIRVVMVWNTPQGKRYMHFKKHYRINTLFANLRNTMVEAQEYALHNPTLPKNPKYAIQTNYG